MDVSGFILTEREHTTPTTIVNSPTHRFTIGSHMERSFQRSIYNIRIQLLLRYVYTVIQLHIFINILHFIAILFYWLTDRFFNLMWLTSSIKSSWVVGVSIHKRGRFAARGGGIVPSFQSLATQITSNGCTPQYTRANIWHKCSIKYKIPVMN